MSSVRSTSGRPSLVGFTALALAVVAAVAACGSDSPTNPAPSGETLQLTSAAVKSLDSSGQVIVTANPGNVELQALVDSTLMVLTAGVEAKRLDVSTDLTTAPLYFVGIHRVYSGPTSSWSTFGVVGIDDPAHLSNLVEVNGFAQSSTSTPPASLSANIGDGTGLVNGLLLQVGAGGSVTEWRLTSGNASFSAGAQTVACPGFTPTAHLTCVLETMHVHFTANAASGSGGAGARQASVTTDVDVPTMRVTYVP